LRLPLAQAITIYGTDSTDKTGTNGLRTLTLQSRVLFPLTAPSRIPEAEQEEAGVSAGLSFMLWNREDYWRFLAALRPAFFRPFFAAFFPPLRPFFAAMMISP